MKRKEFFENLQFLVLAGLIIGQCTVGVNFYFGQGVYLICNLIAVIRNFALQRPIADKIKDFACLGITIGLILFKFFIDK